MVEVSLRDGEKRLPMRRDGRAKRLNKRERKKTHLPAHRTEVVQKPDWYSSLPFTRPGALAFWRSGVLARPITT